MGWGKSEPMWHCDGRPCNDAAREYGNPPWLGKSREQFQREERERERAYAKERKSMAETKRLELEMRMKPKPKVPGRRAIPEVLRTEGGELHSVVCECECGGGLVFSKTGETVSCNFCGGTWVAWICPDSWEVRLRSEAHENVMPASRFGRIKLKGKGRRDG